MATCVRAVVDKTTPTICEFLAKKLIQQHPCLKEKDPREYLKAAGVKVSDKGRPFKNWVRTTVKNNFMVMSLLKPENDKQVLHSVVSPFGVTGCLIY